MHKTFLRLPSQDYRISIKISLWKEKWYYVNNQSQKPRDIEQNVMKVYIGEQNKVR